MDYINLIKRNTEFTINERVYIYIYVKDKLAIIDYRTNNTPLLFRSDRKLSLRLPIMIHLYRDCYALFSLESKFVGERSIVSTRR